MGNKFTSRLLGELCHEITVGFVGSMTNEYIENGIPFLRSKNIDEYDVKWDDMKYVSPEFHKKLSKSALKPGDVAIVRTGKPGTTCVIPNYLSEANCSDIVIARVNDELLCPHYLSYFMNAMAHGQVNAHVVGAVQQHFNVGSAKKIEIPLPSRIMQAEIVKILKALDDKLKLNHQINQTLEQMAQTLFKSWFVDFDPVIDNALDADFFEQDLAFPEELLRRVEVRKAARENSNFKSLPEDIRELFPAAFEECSDVSVGFNGWIPETWALSSIGAEFDVTMGQSPPSSTYNENGEGVPFFQGKSDFGFRFPENRVYCIEPKRMAKQYDTLVSVRAPVGEINLAAENCAIGRGVAAVKHKSGSISFSYYTINSLSKYFEIFDGEGTVFGSINQKDLKMLSLLKSPCEIITAFDKFCSDWDRCINNQSIEIVTLTKLRDTLLPKLISGELSLSDIKIDSVDYALA